MSNSVAPVGADCIPIESTRSRKRRSPRRRRRPWSKSKSKSAGQPSFDQGPIDVSVCIANWNCCDLLRACLASLHDQSQGVRLETIVADNASTDGAPEIVVREFPEVILHRNSTNLGFARANNQAAQRARGRYLFFLNNDTVVPAGTLRQLIDFADAHPEVGIVGPRLRDGQGQLQISYRPLPTLWALLHRTSVLRWTGLLRNAYRRYRRPDFDPDVTRPVEVLMGAAMLLPRKVFFDCGGWDEDFVFGGEDAEISARVGRHHEVVYYPRVEITHFGRVSTRQQVGYASSNIALGVLRYLQKSGYSRPILFFYKLVITLDAPLHSLIKLVQFLWRRAFGRKEKADRSLLAMRGYWHFLIKGIVPFWRA
jgi:GT2 family glycosyltransferase